MTQNNADQMPRAVALTLLTSGQKMTGSFRRTCQRATGKEIQPTNRVALVSPAAPATAEQKLLKKLGKASARQLFRWAKRLLRRGNLLQDQLSDVEPESATETAIKAAIANTDGASQAIGEILDKRSNGARLKKENDGNKS